MTLTNHLIILSQTEISVLPLVSVGLVHPVFERSGEVAKAQRDVKEILTALKENTAGRVQLRGRALA